MRYINNDKNIIVNQIFEDQKKGTISIKEIVPTVDSIKYNNALTLDKKGKLQWSSYIKDINQLGKGITICKESNNILEFKSLISGNNISINVSDNNIIFDVSLNDNYNIFEDNNKLKGTELFIDSSRIGLGRIPLYTYKFDIAVPKNTLMTAFHVGDGSFGFSFGNGTNQGFIPEIIGMGSDENDPGLYFLSKSGNDVSSNIPLIVFDSISKSNSNINNRPIFGIKSGKSSSYDLIIKNGKIGIGKLSEIYKLEVNGSIKANDFVTDNSISFKELINVIFDQKKQIDILKKIVGDILCKI